MPASEAKGQSLGYRPSPAGQKANADFAEGHQSHQSGKRPGRSGGSQFSGFVCCILLPILYKFQLLLAWPSFGVAQQTPAETR